MKANELRIGNYIKHIHLGDHVIIGEILKDRFRTNYRIEFPYNEFEPIPLTEEWLIKFGGWYDEQTELFILGDLDITCFRGEFKLYEWYTNLVIKYVHQLQNIYFALTGEELKIK